MAAISADPFLARRRLLRPALAVAALAVLGGCTPRYTDAQACADLSTMVWPWQSLDSVQTETVAISDAMQIAAFPATAVRVSGTLDRPAPASQAGVETVSAVFQCEHRGDLLYSFGWVEPDMLSRLDQRINRPTAAPGS